MNSLYDLTELKVRLQHEQFTLPAALEVLAELEALGIDAHPLMPALAARIAEGSYVFTLVPVIRVYLANRHPDLLAAIRSSPTWSYVNIPDRARLFGAGASDLEPELLRYLWEHFSDPCDPGRHPIALSLSEAGSAAALDILRIIDSRLSSDLAERGAALADEPEPMAKTWLTCQASFLTVVREAYNNIQSRNTSPGTVMSEP